MAMATKTAAQVSQVHKNITYLDKLTNGRARGLIEHIMNDRAAVKFMERKINSTSNEKTKQLIRDTFEAVKSAAIENKKKAHALEIEINEKGKLSKASKKLGKTSKWLFGTGATTLFIGLQDYALIPLALSALT
ncbi:MAG: hypothetical protein ABIH99_05520, partial [Candidatus Micrarchaeota archaeon]